MAFEILQIPRDDQSIHTYVERYKAFRLRALKTNPEAFGSTYAREIAFTDDIWYHRLANPKATTFVTLQSDKVVCTLTTIGPLPYTVEESSPATDPWIVHAEIFSEPPEYHLRINGMFTLPEVRGQGVAQALLEHVLAYGTGEAMKYGKRFAGAIVVDSDNPGARALYQKCGFVTVKEVPFNEGRPRMAMLLKYTTRKLEV